MGLYDRDYTQADSRRQYFGSSQIRFNWPRITPVVKWLLIANAVIHLFQVVAFSGAMHSPLELTPLEQLFSVYPATALRALQVWRLVTYQFLHGNILHLLLNMLVLFFLGPTLEKHWGSRRFLQFYLGCGVAGGLLYLALVAVGLLGAAPLLGASGAILGVLAACAILFPQFIVFIFFFPVPIRVFAVIMTLWYLINILRVGPNAGGDAAHFGGMAAGAAYILLLPKWDRFKLKLHTQSWEKRMEEGRKLRIEVDRILAKVHRSGLHSLTATEKRILKKATQEELRRHEL